MEQALQLPRLNLDAFVSQPKFLAPIDPPTFPFPPPTWIHATIVHHEMGATYLVDLGSAHGTFVDGLRLTALQPTLVVHGAVLKFGASSRSYTFKVSLRSLRSKMLACIYPRMPICNYVAYPQLTNAFAAFLRIQLFAFIHMQSFESREQIAELLSTRVGLPREELELQQNTMLNSQISHRLELSPTLRSQPLLFPLAAEPPAPAPEDPDPDASLLLPGDECVQLLNLAGVGPVRKRSRGQSGNSQASSDQSGSTADLSVYLDDPADEQQGEPKRVHFCGQPPEVIPDSDAELELEPLDMDTTSAQVG
ncbi:hypothetical protein BBJ28_00008406 [Nothophytophthora sp. Chile5]|nr:hypothetical protein BBJ28_00008406 [Nothophytophthora sp. Chile5]